MIKSTYKVAMEPLRFGIALVISVLLTLSLVKSSYAGEPRVFLLLYLMVSSTAECRFKYTWQPPSTTLDMLLNDCDPYMMRHINIMLECRVTKQTRVTDQFYIRWFRENTNGAEDLGLGSIIGSADELVSQYKGLTNRMYKPSFLGKYWCQVIINKTAGPDWPLTRSNVFTLLNSMDYSGSTCPPLQRVKNETCADLPAQSNQTTLPAPVPTTTTDMSATHRTSTSQGWDPGSEYIVPSLIRLS